MIVVCKKCYTPFLVPDSLLSKEGKLVKCGKCGNKWIEMPIQKPKPAPPKPAKKPIIYKSEEIIKRVSVIKKQIKKETKEAFTVKNFIKYSKIATAVCSSFLVLIIIFFLFSHDYVVSRWPAMQSIYVSIGLADYEYEKLILSNITSKRQYVDGAMQLIVSGIINCRAKKTQVIPYINADAVSPDGRIIQSWQIKPPKATIKPKESMRFKSIIISPLETVTEINLSFVEKPHDKEE